MLTTRSKRSLGGPSPTGLWTQVWAAFDRAETVDFRPSPGEPRSEAWQPFASVPGEFDDWFAPVSRTTVLPQGHLYYRVQLRASYPQPDNTASGAAGGRVTGLYFTTAPQTSLPGNAPRASGETRTVTGSRPPGELGASAGDATRLTMPGNCPSVDKPATQ